MGEHGREGVRREVGVPGAHLMGEELLFGLRPTHLCYPGVTSNITKDEGVGPITI
jgi:hypothetical protein